MADIFDQISTQSTPQQGQGDIFDQVAAHKSSAYDQWILNPLVHAANAIAPAVNGIAKGFGFPEDQKAKPMAEPDMTNAPFAAKVLGDVAGGASQGAAATVAGGGNPILGYGALAGLSAYGEDKPVVPAAIGGAISAVPQMLLGQQGSNLANALAKPVGGMVAKVAPRVGTALGMGGAAAGQAALTGGNPLEAAASGATFGAFSPMAPSGTPKVVTPEEHAKIIDQGSGIYRNILNPGKGIINKVEIKSGKDINDSMALAAKMALPIESQEGKLDNSKAIDIVKQAPAPLYDQQNQMLSSNPAKQFNLEDLGHQVKAKLDGEMKSASDLASAKAKVDNEINAEILRHGTPQEDGSIDPNVDGVTLNKIKQGMWSKSYNPLEPNANDSARAIGFAAKDAIEKGYPDLSIGDSNAQIGQYLQLQKILEATHGQVVQGGKIGGYAAQGIGALAGHASHIPGAEIAGGYLGGKVKAFLNDPARITGDWAKKLAGVKVEQPQPASINNPLNPVGTNPDEFPKSVPISELNPLSSPKEGLLNEEANPKGTLNNKGNVGNKVMGLGVGLATAGALALGAHNANANKPTELRKIVVNNHTLGSNSVFNPVNSQTQTLQKPEKANMQAGEYTMHNEGFKGIPYLDTLGNKTVGYGFKMDGAASQYIPKDVKEGRRAMTKEEAQHAFNMTYPKAMERAQKFAGPSWELLSDSQKKVLADMSYQMEGKLNGFHKLQAAIQGGHYNTAAKEILHSHYAKQAPKRAKQNAILIQQ